MTMRHLCHTAVCSAVCLLILLLAGCTAGTDRDLLWYQDGMSAAILTESDSGRVWRIVPTDGGFTAELTEPASVRGITFTVSETEAYASAGDVRIPVNDAMLTGARRALSCLTLSEDDLTGIDPSPEGGVTARFTAENAQYELRIAPDGLPAAAELRENGTVFRYEITVETEP